MDRDTGIDRVRYNNILTDPAIFVRVLFFMTVLKMIKKSMRIDNGQYLPTLVRYRDIHH